MKKFYGLIFVFLLIVSTCFAVTSFKDVTPSHWAYKPIMQMRGLGILSGYPDGTFRPDQNVTRAEFAKILVSALEIPADSGHGVLNFKDVPEGHWAKKFVDSVNRYLTGYDVGGELYYFPDESAVREDVAAALVLAFNLGNEKYSVNSITRFSDYSTISEGFRKYVAIAYENGLINGYNDGTFRAQESLTRAQIAQLISNAFSLRDKLANKNKPTATPVSATTKPNEVEVTNYNEVKASVVAPKTLTNDSIVYVRLDRALFSNETIDIMWEANNNELITSPGQ